MAHIAATRVKQMDDLTPPQGGIYGLIVTIAGSFFMLIRWFGKRVLAMYNENQALKAKAAQEQTKAIIGSIDSLKEEVKKNSEQTLAEFKSIHVRLDDHSKRIEILEKK